MYNEMCGDNRILDWFGHEGLDADEIVRQKMAYNRGRPYKHGKRC